MQYVNVLESINIPFIVILAMIGSLLVFVVVTFIIVHYSFQAYEKKIAQESISTRIFAVDVKNNKVVFFNRSDMKNKKEAAIAAKEQELASLQMQYFGPEGELFTKRIELIQPIQEKVYNAISQVAQLKSYSFVFDKASGSTILYCSDKYDISDDVLDEIGNVMQTVRRQDRKRGGNTPAAGNKTGGGGVKGGDGKGSKN